MPGNVDLTVPLVKHKKGEKPSLALTTPFTAAAMQSVSGADMAVALSKLGGVAFIFCSQTVSDQAAMVAAAKGEGATVGAAVNTRDYKERIPELVKAGVDVLCIDSSDGYSEWQKDVIIFVRETYGETVKIGAGNVVDADAFEYLADAGADFIKVGIGGGSICITREQKGIGRGQASALISVVEARDKYFEKTKTYIPICSDGGIVFDNHIILALAMGADFVMMGRYFARFAESPSKKVTKDGKTVKEYWGEGSARARNWQRYDSGENNKLVFEEGVDSYIPFEGSIHDYLPRTIHKIKSTMCNCGSLTVSDFTKNACLTVISNVSAIEGGAHDVVVK
jgi:IMP dehydrogenase